MVSGQAKQPKGPGELVNPVPATPPLPGPDNQPTDPSQITEAKPRQGAERTRHLGGFPPLTLGVL